MSQRTALLRGLAALLAAETDAGQHIAWPPPDGGIYPPDVTGIYLKDVPATPDRIVAVSLYDLADDAVYADTDIGFQIRTRGIPNNSTDVDDLDEALCDVLIGRWPLTVAGITIQTLERTSGATLGQDPNLRWSLTSNFTLSVCLPGTHRL